MQGLDAIEAKLKGLQNFKKDAARIAMDGLMAEKEFVVDMIFQEQLFETGVNGYNVPIMDYKPYSPATIFIKEEKGQPTDRVTLRDTGDFHSDGDLERISDTEALVLSTDPKSESLQDKYGKEILWLIPDNLDETRQFYVLPYMENEIRKI